MQRAEYMLINVFEERVSELSAHECREKLHDVVQKHNYAVLIFIAHFQTCFKCIFLCLAFVHKN